MRLPTIDWERWLGVRAAAVLGAIFLALAGVYLFQYSIAHGLIPPWLRVVLVTVLGVGCIAASEWVLRERYEATANALAGGGVTLLYSAFWAAGVLYKLVGLEFAFVLMATVTANCCVLSWRHESLVIALLGLVGGFATPLLLSSGADRPIGLFGYVLLLDLALLYLSRRRRWPLLALLSLVGTVLYQALWIGTRMGPHRVTLALAILGVFAVVFALGGGRRSPAERGTRADLWAYTQTGGVLLPFLFAFYLAARADLGPHLYPVAMLLVLLSAAAGWISRTQAQPELGVAAAAASVGVVAVWALGRQGVTAYGGWEAASLCVLLALPFHAFIELDRDRADRSGPARAAMVTSIGFLGLLVLASVEPAAAALWPWLVGWVALAALLYRHASFPARGGLHLVAALGIGLGFWFHYLAHGRDPTFPTPPWTACVAVALAVVFQVEAFERRRLAAWRSAEQAAALLALLFLLPFLSDPPLRPWMFLGASLALGFLATLAATRLGAGRWFFAAAVSTALVHTLWSVGRTPTPSAALVGIAVELGAVALFTAWPFLTSARFGAEPWAWRAAALAGPIWFPSLRHLFTLRFGDGFIGLLPLVLGGIALAAARATARWPAEAPARRSALVWFSAVALGFVSVAIPLQLEKQWITIGWALEGVAVMALWKRLDHPGLKYFGLGLLAATTARLVTNPAVLGYYPRPSWRIVNWLAYTYLVPAAALLGAGVLLRDDEVPRARAWERGAYRHGHPIGALAAGLAGLIVIFVWINLAIADWYATGATLRIDFERVAARDLTTSIAWAIYALVLLALGVARASIGLRWVSLGLMLVTIGKVFLYDLGQLQDLYRVASLFGLALSLIAVSLAYQRFVFRKAPAEEAG